MHGMHTNAQKFKVQDMFSFFSEKKRQHDMIKGRLSRRDHVSPSEPIVQGNMPKRARKTWKLLRSWRKGRRDACAVNNYLDDAVRTGGYLLNWETFLNRGAYRSGSSSTGSASRISFLA